MIKKLGMPLAMILLTTLGARSATLSPAASPAWQTGTSYACPFIPANCCKFKVVGSCPVCVQTC